MSEPIFRPLTLGDTSDDDGQVLDQLFEAEPNPPTVPVAPVDTPPLPQPTPSTRLLTRRQSVDPTWSTLTQLLPEDTRRKNLVVRVTSPDDTATDGIIIRSDNGPALGGAFLAHGQDLTLIGHTGAVLVAASGAAAVNVDVWSVTE